MPAVQHLTRTGQFQTTVSDVRQISPRMRRIALTAPEITTRDWPLACDLAVVLAGADREIRRRYTVRSVVDDTVLLDAVLHGHGPGASWAQSVRPDDQVTVIGPRGEIVLAEAEADWLLAITDESGLPAVAALAEADAGSGRPFLLVAEIADERERYPLPEHVSARWLVRGDVPAGGTSVLAPALAELGLPAGDGFGYLLGESRAVVSLRDQLGEFGLHRARVYAKGYWNLNSRPTR